MLVATLYAKFGLGAVTHPFITRIHCVGPVRRSEWGASRTVDARPPVIYSLSLFIELYTTSSYIPTVVLSLYRVRTLYIIVYTTSTVKYTNSISSTALTAVELLIFYN